MSNTAPPSLLGRRSLMMASLMTGFTRATARAETAPIHTDSTGLIVEEVAIPVADGTIPAYAARPAAAAPAPVVIVIEEIFGVHEYIKDVCRRLAKRGYLAVAPELYARLADLSRMTDVHQIVSQVIAKAPDATVLSDLSATVDWAIRHQGDAARVATLGFCRGGRDAWLFAAHETRLKAAVAFYGPVTGTPSAIQPHTPLDLADQLHCPLLGLYGGLDPSIRKTDVYAAQAKAEAAGKTVAIIYYPDAGHGFHADYRPSYNPHDAEAAWAQALAWLRRYDVG